MDTLQSSPNSDLPIIQHLEFLTRIPSATTNIQGVYKVQREIENFLRHLEFDITYYPHPTHMTAPLLVGTLNLGYPKTISYILHADTVLESNPQITFDGSYLRGSGVADDKGGIVVALHSLLKFLNLKSPHFNIQFISSPSEEIGSPGFHKILKHLGQKSDYIFGFEPSLADGSLISSRNGNRWYEIHVQGREAHSGRCNGEELNAAHELSHMIIDIQKSVMEINGAKAHIGHINAGQDKFNVVCGHAYAKLDTRFSSFLAREQLHSKIEAIVQTHYLQSSENYKCIKEFHIADDCPPMQSNQLQTQLTHYLSQHLKLYEKRNIQCKHSGGAADINYMSHSEAVCIDGLGPVGGNLHCEDEYIEIESLATRTQMVFELLKKIDTEVL